MSSSADGRTTPGAWPAVLQTNDRSTKFLLPSWRHERSYSPLPHAIATRREDPDGSTGAPYLREGGASCGGFPPDSVAVGAKNRGLKSLPGGPARGPLTIPRTA